MIIQAIHIEFNAPQAYDMIRLRLHIQGMPLSTSVFCRDWIELIDFLMVANVFSYVSISAKGLE